MTDTKTEDEEFESEMLAAFDADDAPVETPATPPAPAVDPNDPAPATPPAPNAEDEDDPADPKNPNEEDEEPETPPADPKKPEEENPENPENPETPPAEDEPKPLTEEGVRRLLNEARSEEQNSTKELRNTFDEVMGAYYPDGLSNTLVDQNSGKALKTPQDVIDASGGDMSMEEATQWLMNEQYKLDQSINDIKRQAAQIAETTVNFKRDSLAVLEKYDPLFKAYPQLQTKAFNLMMKQVKADEKKGVILSAPDVMDLYDTYLEPYQQAYEFSTKKSATNPTAPVNPTPPAPATPGQADRMDEGADGGQSPVDDPNDFAQQVEKELAKPF